MRSGEIRNADRKCKAKTNFAACGKPNLGAYAANPRQRNITDLLWKTTHIIFKVDWIWKPWAPKVRSFCPRGDK